MTDNEIIKALECCCIEHVCVKCPYVRNNKCGCINGILRDSLDLINRLQMENKELHDAFYNKDRIKVVQTKAIKEFAERLKNIYIKDKRYDRPNAHTLIDWLFANIDNLVKEMVGEGK